MASKPMTCDEARARFSALVDDELTAVERHRVEGHLGRCPVCLPEWTSFARTVALFRSAPPSSAPPGFVDRVLARVRPRRRRRWWAVGAGPRVAGLRPLPVAALVLIAVAAVYVFERTPEVRQAARPERVEPPPAVPSAAPPVPAPAPPATGRSLMKAEPPPAEKSAAAGPARRPESSASRPVSPPAPAQETPPTARQRDAAAGTKPPSPAPTAPAPARAKKPPPSAIPASRSAEVAAKTERDESRLEAASRPRQAGGGRAAESEAPTGRLVTAAQARVFGTLRVDDRRGARATVLALAGRLGGGEAGRRPDRSDEVIELVVPGDRYREFVAELGRLGTWVAAPAPVSGVAGVSVSLRLGE